MFCRYCGKEIRENLNYCTQCGKRLREHEPVLRKQPVMEQQKAEKNHPTPVPVTTKKKEKSGKIKIFAFVAITLAVIVAGGILFGVSRRAKVSDSTETTSSWESVKESGKIRIAITTDAEYKKALANALAEKLGLEAEIVEVDYTNRFSCIEDGAADCVLTGENKLHDIDYSNAMYKIPLSIVVKKENISWYRDSSKLMKLLADKTFALVEDSKGSSVFDGQKVWSKTDSSIVSSEKKALKMVSKGQADATIIPTSKDIAKYDDLKKIDGLITFDLVFGVEKGNDLQEQLNDAIKELEEDGTLDQIAKENHMY